MSSTTSEQPKQAPPTSEEFVTTLGRVAWLLTISPEHRNQKIDLIERNFSAPLVFKQVRVYMRDKQPIAAISFAFASPDIKAKIEAGGYEMKIEDWRSGDEVIVVECISPLAPATGVLDVFYKEISEVQLSSKA